MYVGIVVSNLDAIAYHLEEGIDNGGVSKEDLALFLRSVARDLETEFMNCSYKPHNPEDEGFGW